MLQYSWDLAYLLILHDRLRMCYLNNVTVKLMQVFLKRFLYFCIDWAGFSCVGAVYITALKAKLDDCLSERNQLPYQKAWVLCDSSNVLVQTKSKGVEQCFDCQWCSIIHCNTINIKTSHVVCCLLGNISGITVNCSELLITMKTSIMSSYFVI